nr:killer cell lectin-like receptor subfamily B member 1B allele C isoform X1 [Pelodiscus sinensis]|eukprot:XP_014424487.2 killer cell lectin-like receptor subfamily B member 1B allele C isoform X1 [Pelodiscus sinensis]
MEDEEGYTSLHLRPKVRTADRSRQPETQDHPPCPCWHRLALRLGAAWFLVQVASVILTGIWVFQPRRCLNCLENNSTGERLIPQCNGSPGLTDFQSRLKQFVCESSPSNSAEGPGCKLCPPDWLLHRDKCYWVSKNRTPWNKSRDDCSGRGSRLLVIRDQAEMTFIQTNSKDTNEVWLGLTSTSPTRNWTWMDGSLLNTTLFKAVHPPKGNTSCGVIKAYEIHFESCSAASKWICEKDAFLV